MISELQIEKNRARGVFGDAARGKSGVAAPTVRTGGQPTAASEAAAHPPARDAERAATAGATGDSAAAARREIHLTPRQKLERAIHEDPTDLDRHLQLAQLHLDEERLAEAETVLKRALAVSGNDLTVREKYEDVTIQRHRQQLSVAERLAASEQTRESQELVAQLRAELNRRELEIYRGRCERYPQDTANHYQLGVRLKRAGSFAEAIVQFTGLGDQAPQADAAALELGECYQQLKQYQPALKWYRRAVEAGRGGHHPEVRKLALYRGGVLAAALKELAVAESLFQQLLELDSGYKDAADRLDKVRQIRHKEGP